MYCIFILLHSCSIDHLSEVVRNAIETSTHIKEELLINQEDFLVNEVRLYMPESLCNKYDLMLIVQLRLSA